MDDETTEVARCSVRHANASNYAGINIYRLTDQVTSDNQGTILVGKTIRLAHRERCCGSHIDSSVIHSLFSVLVRKSYALISVGPLDPDPNLRFRLKLPPVSHATLIRTSHPS